MFRLEEINSRALPRKGIAFSPDGGRIATAMLSESKDADPQMTGTVTLWDVNNGREMLRLSCPWGSVSDAIEFSPDGFRLTARGAAGVNSILKGAATVTAWDATPR